MIYTVTLNPAIDKTAVIENFCAGAVNRIGALREDAGGKGINVSKCLKKSGGKLHRCHDFGRRCRKTAGEDAGSYADSHPGRLGRG